MIDDVVEFEMLEVPKKTADDKRRLLDWMNLLIHQLPENGRFKLAPELCEDVKLTIK